MRVSVDREDSGWHEAMNLGIDLSCVLITVDGQPYRHTITADTEYRFLRVVKLDEEGQATAKGNDLRTRLIRGAVEIRLLARPDGSWPHAPDLMPPYTPARALHWRAK